jgi:hypothetical protein
MSKTSGKSTAKSDVQHTPDIEQDDDDVFDGGDFIALPEDIEEETVKRDARRKIEIYWEKKRLKEQFEDFDESEFGF